MVSVSSMSSHVELCLCQLFSLCILESRPVYICTCTFNIVSLLSVKSV